MNKEVEYIEDGHIYLVDGVRLPSVTQIIGHFIPSFYKNNGLHKEIGKAVHYATELWDKGKLDWSSLDDRIIPQVTAYVDFVDSYNFKPLLIEHKMAINEGYNSFAGTCDRIGNLNGKTCVLDIKCSDGVIKTVDIQTAMYSMLYGKAIDRYALYLRSNGRFKLQQFKDETDYKEAEAMIFLYNRFLEKGDIKL